MKRFIFLLLTATLSGCNPWTTIDENMRPMRGQPINMLFARLGYPTGEGNVANEHFYVWSNGGSVYIPDVSTTNGFGAVGGQPFNYSQTTVGGGSVAQLHCTMRIFVNQDNLITHWDGGGNNGACAQYADRLKQSAQMIDNRKSGNYENDLASAQAHCDKLLPQQTLGNTAYNQCISKVLHGGAQ